MSRNNRNKLITVSGVVWKKIKEDASMVSDVKEISLPCIEYIAKESLRKCPGSTKNIEKCYFEGDKVDVLGPAEGDNMVLVFARGNYYHKKASCLPIKDANIMYIMAEIKSVGTYKDDADETVKCYKIKYSGLDIWLQQEYMESCNRPRITSPILHSPTGPAPTYNNTRAFQNNYTITIPPPPPRMLPLHDAGVPVKGNNNDGNDNIDGNDINDGIDNIDGNEHEEEGGEEDNRIPQPQANLTPLNRSMAPQYITTSPFHLLVPYGVHYTEQQAQAIASFLARECQLDRQKCYVLPDIFREENVYPSYPAIPSYTIPSIY